MNCFFNGVDSNIPLQNQMMQDLESKRAQLTQTEYLYAHETIRAIFLLESQADSLSEISGEEERNLTITELTGLIAEPGLVEGEAKSDILKNLSTRVDLLKKAYLFDSERSDTIALFREAFIGPPCFNGRVITLQKYVSEKQNFIPTSLKTDPTDYDAFACQVEEAMYEYEETRGSQSQNGVPEKNAFMIFLQQSYPSLLEEININPQAYQRACEFFVR